MKRVAIIVLDSVGIGELPDAAKYGDEGSNTLVNIKKEYPEFSVPNMAELGLGNIEGEDICLLGKTDSPKGCYAKMSEASNGKDTTTGHWEISGIVTENPFPTFTETGFPPVASWQFPQDLIKFPVCFLSIFPCTFLDHQ